MFLVQVHTRDGIDAGLELLTLALKEKGIPEDNVIEAGNDKECLYFWAIVKGESQTTPTDRICVQQGSVFPIGFKITNEDQIRYIRINQAKELRDNLNWAIESAEKK